MGGGGGGGGKGYVGSPLKLLWEPGPPPPPPLPTPMTVTTKFNKSMVYFIVRRNVKFGCSECQSVFDVKSGLRVPIKSILVNAPRNCTARQCWLIRQFWFSAL